MPLPTKRHSKSRKGKRRSHHKLVSPSISLCPKCKEPKLPHRICLSCGSYKDRKVLI